MHLSAGKNFKQSSRQELTFPPAFFNTYFAPAEGVFESLIQYGN